MSKDNTVKILQVDTPTRRGNATIVIPSGKLKLDFVTNFTNLEKVAVCHISSALPLIGEKSHSGDVPLDELMSALRRFHNYAKDNFQSMRDGYE